MEIVSRVISFLSQKKRALFLLLISLAGFFLFLTSSLGPNNLLRADSELYHVDFDGVAFMTVFIVGFSAYILSLIHI